MQHSSFSKFHILFLFEGIVVQNDLVDALKNGTIFAAGLDVMVPEPLPADDVLTKLPNCGEFTFLCFSNELVNASHQFCCCCCFFLFSYVAYLCTPYSAYPTFGIGCCSNPK